MKFAHFSQIFPRPGESAAERYEQLWRELQLCDELGFDYGFSSVHHFDRLRPQATVYCTGAAARTRHLRLGPMGYTVALYEPIRIVEEAVVLDNITHGRLDVGLTTGVTFDEFRVYQADWDNRAARAVEGMLLLKKAFLSQQPFDFAGPYHQYQEVCLAAELQQKPMPPIWLMSITPEILEVLAREGVHTGYLFQRSRREAAERLKEYLHMWGEYGHSYPPNIIYLTFVYVDDTDEAALRNGLPHIMHSMEVIYGAHGDTPAYTQHLGSQSELGRPEIRRHLDDAEFLLEQDLILVGSPQTVARKLKAAAEEGLFNVFGAELNVGTLPEADMMRSIRLFGTEVIPALKNVDPTLEWIGRGRAGAR